MNHPLIARIALTLIPNIGPVFARLLLEHLDPGEIFTAKRRVLEAIPGLGKVRVDSIKSFQDFDRAEKEMQFIEQFKITPLFITDAGYPRRLLNCYDAPVLLYYKGTADLNTSRIVSVVGSRLHTEYGRLICEQLMEAFSENEILVISGLAYGVDALAHKYALKNKLETVGVLAHGLDKIYPPGNTAMAKEMLQHGGLLTEFASKTKPDKHNFPSRNRIVAGMSDAVVVVETDIKGGSMITAELANGYNIDVFAVPGKITDKKSSGCNYLIRSNKAALLTDGKDLIELMGWAAPKKRPTRKQVRELFVHLTPEERIVVDILTAKDQAGIDEIHLRSGLSSSSVAVAVLNLEMQHILQALPGKMYKLI